MLVWARHYLLALITLVILAGVYRATVDPWLEPPEVQSVPIATLPALRGDDSLADLFPEGAWQRGTCKRLQTSDGVLLFDRWQQTSDDQWKLWPISVVIGRGLSGNTKSEPIVITSDEGAEIRFKESFDPMSGGAPPISRGRIIGNVQIRRVSNTAIEPTSGATKSSPTLDIRTANLGIDNRKIWTTEAIEMHLGGAYLYGRDLTMHLAAAAGSPSSGANASALLDRMELIYLDKLVLPLKTQDAGQTNSNSSSPQPGVQNQTPAMISVACDGRVEYDFALDRLSLRENVSLVHQAPLVAPDRFECQSLEMTLRDPMNDSLIRTSPMDWLFRIQAKGNPAIAVFPSYEIELAAEMIDLDATTGLVQALGGSGVRVRYGAINARLSRLGYQFDPKNPKRIGAVDAFGSGLVEVEDPKLPLRQVRWTKGFKMQPLGAVTPDAIDADIALFIDGDVTALLADGGEFRAESVEGVLKPDKKPTQPNALAQSTNDRPGLRPDRFQAIGGVRLDTAAIAVQTQRLMLYFIESTQPAPARVNPDGSVATDAPPPSFRQWVSQPDAANGGIVKPIARQRPTLRGDSIKAELRLDPSGISAKDLAVMGSVEVLHSINAGNVPLDARLTGQQLRLQDAGGEDVMQLDGTAEAPARFELGDGYFVGPQIQIRPSDNIVWINSAGEFQMPTAVLPTGLDNTAASSNANAKLASSKSSLDPNVRINPLIKDDSEPTSKITWTKPPRCTWQGEMIFDGHSAVLTEGVDIQAELINGEEPWQIHLTGDRLDVVLEQNVQVRDVQSIRQAAIRSIVLMQSDERPLIAEAYQRTPQGALNARHLLSAPKLTLMPATGGKLIGEGPGWYRGWMLASKPQLGSETNQFTPSVPGEAGLNGVHLTFHESMLGDLLVKNLEFNRSVRVATKPIANWTDAFDANKMETVGIDESTLDCDRLRFTVDPQFSASNKSTSGSSIPWEMEASGGVVFKTRNERGLFDGTASRAAYASAKEIFVIENAPNRPATLRKTLPDGKPGPEVEVVEATINTGTMEIQMVPLRFNFGTLPTK